MKKQKYIVKLTIEDCLAIQNMIERELQTTSHPDSRELLRDLKNVFGNPEDLPPTEISK